MTLVPDPASSLTRRGTCDPSCQKVAAVDKECKAAASYEKCACTTDNFNALDDCITCLIADLQANEAANAILTGGEVVGISGTTAESIRAQGNTLEKQIIQACAAAGVPIGGSTTAGSTSSSTSSGSSTSGSTTGGGTTGGASAGGSGTSGAASTATAGASSAPGLGGAANGVPRDGLPGSGGILFLLGFATLFL